jgi:hypothetical protein
MAGGRNNLDVTAVYLRSIEHCVDLTELADGWSFRSIRAKGGAEPLPYRHQRWSCLVPVAQILACKTTEVCHVVEFPGVAGVVEQGVAVLASEEVGVRVQLGKRVLYDCLP